MGGRQCWTSAQARLTSRRRLQVMTRVVQLQTLPALGCCLGIEGMHLADEV